MLHPLFCRMLASDQGGDGHGGAVLLVVVVHGKVPPTSVFLLQGQQDVGQMVLEVGLAVGRQLLDALGRVVVTVVIKISSNGKM
jgi:hypothetical protein